MERFKAPCVLMPAEAIRLSLNPTGKFSRSGGVPDFFLEPPMNLATAIRAGIVGRDVVEGAMFQTHNGAVVACCALGAAAIAVFGEQKCARAAELGEEDLMVMMRAHFPSLGASEEGQRFLNHFDPGLLGSYGLWIRDVTLESAIAYVNDMTPRRPEDIATALEELGIER